MLTSEMSKLETINAHTLCLCLHVRIGLSIILMKIKVQYTENQLTET